MLSAVFSRVSIGGSIWSFCVDLEKKEAKGNYVSLLLKKACQKLLLTQRKGKNSFMKFL